MDSGRVWSTLRSNWAGPLGCALLKLQRSGRRERGARSDPSASSGWQHHSASQPWCCPGVRVDNEVLRFGWPSGVTPQAERMRDLWTWSVVAALVMGILVWGLTFWVIIVPPKKKDSPEFPRQTAYNVPLELRTRRCRSCIIACPLLLHGRRAELRPWRRKTIPTSSSTSPRFQWNWKFGYRTIDLQDGSQPSTTASTRQPRKQPQTEQAPKRDEDAHAELGPIHGRDGRGPVLPALRQDRDRRHQQRDSRSWSSRPVSGSSSSSRRPTSSTRSGCRSSCSSVT